MLRFLPALLIWTLLAVSSTIQAQIELATDAPKPLPAEESRKLFVVPEGFRVELVAAEPHLADPTAIAFAPNGRIFVCELHGYNLEGYLDVLDLNKTGELDKKVRRIDAPPEAIQRAAKEQFGTVKMLEDTDGDGRVDRAIVWADHLPPCYGVAAARDGVVVLCAPDIIYLGDTNGDGKADVREKLFTGFGTKNLWSRINNPRWGLDNWIYGVGGIGSSGTISGPRLAQPVQISDVCFRFKPDGTAFEPVSGFSHGFGLAMSDWGDRFLVTNQQHVLFVAPLEYHYLIRNPYYAAPNPVVNISSYGHPARVYPTSKPDPWRRARGSDPAWVKFYGEKEATANGYFTAASGQTIYRGEQFPAEYYGNHFSVDNAQNMVHRCLLVPQGAGYSARRPRADEKTEFLTSTEQWFRPVNLETGPDGALYIVDMYRDIIEDYSAIPRYLQQLYINSIIAGSDRGRIWRVVHESGTRPKQTDITQASPKQLIEMFSATNAWRRQSAQNLLVTRGDKSLAEPLTELAKNGKTPQARLHALYTLDGLNSLETETIKSAFADPHFSVRKHALRLAESLLPKHPKLLDKIVPMVDDPHARVRLQLAFTLGQSDDPRATQALAVLAANHGNDEWMQAGILSSTSKSSGALLVKLLANPGKQGRSLMRHLGSIMGARHDDNEIGRFLATIAKQQGKSAIDLQTTCLEGLLDGLKHAKPRPLNSVEGRRGMGNLLKSPSEKIRRLALRAAGQLQLQNSPEIKAAIAAAEKLALDDKHSLEDRVAATNLLACASYEQLASATEKLLDSRQPLALQLAAVSAISASDDPRVGSLLLERYAAYTPKLQLAAINAVFARQNRLPALLDALENEEIPIAALDASRRLQLKENSQEQIRLRARQLLSTQTAKGDLGKTLAKYQSALTSQRDPKHGKLVFDEQCAKCHKLQGQGFEVGPDLSVVKSKSDEMLVSDVLDPNNQITVGYSNYTVVTEDGRIFTGVLSGETATSITLQKEEGVKQTILRNQIDEMAASPLSMMPEGLEKDVSPKDVVDLIAYLRQCLGKPLSTVMLFEDEQAFVDTLAEGTGIAMLCEDDHHSGKASLSITPPQRFSLTIPGWNYRIVEKPGPGEFRYIRFAWKSRGAVCVMLEFADAGQWPPAGEPLRRYYTGTNTTGWQAARVSSELPQEWTVVTRDLWKDFGDFTLTGIAPTAMGGEALFDHIELLRSLDEEKDGQ
ncbi:MAG: HEAT repeat domain-containing protein [Pirellulales bacterium]|nr:HEAT repeat domain-containing protein [Pirellulales bacterium]